MFLIIDQLAVNECVLLKNGMLIGNILNENVLIQ